MHSYKTQVASDIIRDGLGVELLDEAGTVVAEVFRCDRDRTIMVNTFANDVPLQAMQQLISRARERLEPFEDGALLNEATLPAPRAPKERPK